MVSKLVRHRWSSDVGSGLSRSDRRSCDYDAYLPDLLASRPVALDAETVADVIDAETALSRFNVAGATLADTEALARLLLRAESVASSRIEGLEVGARRLLRAEVATGLGEHSDVTASEVLGNVAAMSWALESIRPGDDLIVDQLLEAHARLLEGTQLDAHAGCLREVQNWIGGSAYNPCSASFVPPPPEAVPELLAELCEFCNDDEVPAVVQAAMAHAQFETIHPFVDGNGRTGRVLTQLVLRRRGLTTRTVPPISLVLATEATAYIAGLVGSRHVGDPTDPEAIEGMNAWIATFAAACRRSVADAEEFEGRIIALQQQWRDRAGRPRSNSATELLIRALPGAPMITVADAAILIGRSFQATNEAVRRLEDAGVLDRANVGRRNRAYEATDVIVAFTDLERQLASPMGDTRRAPPKRRVPYRRQ